MDPQRIDKRLTDYIRPIVSRIWMIIVAVLVATVGVYVYYSHKPNVYTTSTLVYILDQGDPISGAVTGQTDRQVEDEATLLDSLATAKLVAAKIHYQGPVGALLGQVAITPQAGEDFVEVSAHAPTGPAAAAIANGFAQEFVHVVEMSSAQQVASALSLSRAQLAQLGNNNNADATITRDDLIAEIDRLKLAQAEPDVVSTEVDPAPTPTSPSAPQPIRNALFAFALSLLAGIAAAYGLERFDRRLKNPIEMEEAYGRNLLAVLPHASDPSPLIDGEVSLSSDFREPFRVLRTNIELETLDAPPRTIVISSAMSGEGKSTVVRNLALAFREAGKTVVVVDLDLRHPSLHNVFSVPNHLGVTEILRHEAPIEVAILRIPVKLNPFDVFMTTKTVVNPSVAQTNGHNGTNGIHGLPNGTNGRNGHGPARDPEIALITTGALPANPAAVLASVRTVEVLDELKARYDVVIIDSAPVLAVSDTVPLLRYADVALFVGRLGVTTRDTAKRLIDVLDRVPDMYMAGIVANDLSRLDAEGYGYGTYDGGTTVEAAGATSIAISAGPRAKRGNPFTGTRR